MIYGLWQSTSGMQAQQTLQGVIANNLANADTPGFKSQWITLRERSAAAYSQDTLGTPPTPTNELLDGLSGGTTYGPGFTNFAQGSIVKTDEKLDLAIRGDGFLKVRTPEGMRYTRDGRLTMRTDGVLVTATGGHEVVDRGGRPIVLAPDQSADLKIGADGRVLQGGAPVGRIELFDFAEPQKLRKAGGNLLDAGRLATKPAGGEFVPGAYEASGVDPITTMVQMIEASRAYQLNATAVSLQDQTLNRAVNDVGRIA